MSGFEAVPAALDAAADSADAAAHMARGRDGGEHIGSVCIALPGSAAYGPLTDFRDVWTRIVEDWSTDVGEYADSLRAVATAYRVADGFSGGIFGSFFDRLGGR